MTKAAIVVPTIRGDYIAKFLRAWNNEFRDHIVIVIEDNPEPTFDISGLNVKHFSWKDIDRELGKDSWIIPRRTDCIRSYGFLKAYQEKVDIIITLDDDCYPCTKNFVKEHIERLNTPVQHLAWISTGKGVAPRGMPYYNQERKMICVLNHGLWQSVPDLDAVTQLVNTRVRIDFEPADLVIPRGTYFPMCGMNLAFRREITPVMYFLLMGKDWPFDRFGDIWCGIFAKRILDHLGYGVRSGLPWVKHERASNVWMNLRKELLGYEVNEVLWSKVDSIVLTKTTFKECYKELAIKLPLKGDYWDQLRKAMMIWADLFS